MDRTPALRLVAEDLADQRDIEARATAAGIAYFDQEAAAARTVAWPLICQIADQMKTFPQLSDEDLLVLTHALWSAWRRNGNQHLPKVEACREYLEDVMTICAETIEAERAEEDHA